MRKSGAVMVFVCLSALLPGCGGDGGNTPAGDGITKMSVPATGQTTIYATYDNGGYQTIRPMSFTDNGDGTIKDNVTGLLWQKGAGSGFNWYQATGTYDATYNPSSYSACAAIGSGWRLPTRFELMTIVNYGRSYPAMDLATQHFVVYQDAYWASEQIGTDGASVQFAQGPSLPLTKATPHAVRCVSGPKASPGSIHKDNGNGTVTDLTTNLMWQKCSRGQNNNATCSDNVAESDTVDWNSALLYCESLDLGGYSDWRLPNIKELASLSDLTASPYINPIFTNTFASLSLYWSSTTAAGGDNTYAWYMRFDDNGVASGWIKTASWYVRCVRGQ